MAYQGKGDRFTGLSEYVLVWGGMSCILRYRVSREAGFRRFEDNAKMSFSTFSPLASGVVGRKDVEKRADRRR